jgi:polyhydroxyalkanoate synthase
MDGTDPDAGDAGADGSSEPSDDREDDENDESTVGLQSVDGIGPTYAERLHEAGIDSLGALLDADVETLAEATGASSGRAERWLDRARTLRSER